MRARRFAPLAALVCLSLGSVARADDASSRVSFGGDVTVRAGERVRDVTSMGGDLIIDGEVLGDASSMGGDVVVHRGGRVHGDVTTMGGDLRVDPGGAVDGSRVTMGGDAVAAIPGMHVRSSAGPFAFGVLDTLHELASSFAHHVLLFFLGLLLLGLAPERVAKMQRVIVRSAIPAGATGFVAALASAALVALLAITLVGIPAAIVLGLLLAIGFYVGLAVVATVVGAALPVEWLRGKPALQLGAGVLALFVASLVPVAGSLLVALAALVGLGAVVRTTLLRKPDPGDADPTPSGPYRTASA